MKVISTYLSMYEATEVPVLYTRWALHAGISALLQHNVFLPYSSTRIYPNMYVMLMGSPGGRKSSAVAALRPHIIDAGYDSFAYGKGKNDEFLERLAGESVSDKDFEACFGLQDAPNSNIFACAEEANDFFGYHNYPFINSLTSLWDFVGKYPCSTHKHPRLIINNPCISILCANTPSALYESFGTQLLGQGLLSRIIMVHSDLRIDRYAFPDPPDPFAVEEVRSFMRELLTRYNETKITLHPEARNLLKKIYGKGYKVDDVRFSGYNNRRFTHLLKLCLTTMAARLDDTITVEDVIYSNTVLFHTEALMPKALGELGRSKSSETNQAVLSFIFSSNRPVSASEVLAGCKGALGSIEEVIKVCRMFIETGQIQSDPVGFSPRRMEIVYPSVEEINPDCLTIHERLMKI